MIFVLFSYYLVLIDVESNFFANTLIPRLAMILQILGSACNCVGNLVSNERDTIDWRFSLLIP